MSVKEIPKAYEYTCDRCGTTHLQENASGHYSNSRPKHWATLLLQQDSYDYQGQAVVNGDVSFLLCQDCRMSAVKILANFLEPAKL